MATQIDLATLENAPVPLHPAAARWLGLVPEEDPGS
jgi:hypothetical protein